MVKMIREVGETDRTKVRPKLLKASLMNGKRQNMREIGIDDNSNDERQEALARLEQLRKTEESDETTIFRRTEYRISWTAV